MTAPIPDHVIERARGLDLAAIAAARGLTLKRQGHELVGPCPVCGGRDRFAIHVGKQAFHCRGCGGKGGGAISFVQWLDGTDFLTAVGTLVGVTHHSPPRGGGSTVDPTKKSAADATEKRKHAAAANDERERIRKAAAIWRNRKPIIGTIVERYLRDVRRIVGPLPPTLGFLLPWRDVPSCMVAAFGLCEEPEPGVIMPPRTVEAVHLTYLRPDGSGKADMERPKQFRGVVKGAPIVIAPPNDLLGLAITEGIEDALSVHQATGLGAWAAGSTTIMPALADMVPDYIEAVTIYAHRDQNTAGQRGALALARKLAERKIEVAIEGF